MKCYKYFLAVLQRFDMHIKLEEENSGKNLVTLHMKVRESGKSQYIQIYIEFGKDYVDTFGNNFRDAWGKERKIGEIFIVKHKTVLHRNIQLKPVHSQHDVIRQLSEIEKMVEQNYDSDPEGVLQDLMSTYWPVLEREYNQEIDGHLSEFYIYPNEIKNKRQFYHLMTSEEQQFYKRLGAAILCWFLKNTKVFASNNVITLDSDPSQGALLQQYYKKLGFEPCVDYDKYALLSATYGICMKARVSDIIEKCKSMRTFHEMKGGSHRRRRLNSKKSTKRNQKGGDPEVRRFLKGEYEQLSRKEQEAIKQYVKKTPNSLLRMGLDINDTESEQVYPEEVQQIKQLDSAIHKTRSYKEPFTVYRGATIDNETEEYMLKNKYLNNIAFTSASFSKEYAKKFQSETDNCCLFEIIVDPDTKIKYTYVGADPEAEQEVIFQRENHFKLVTINKTITPHVVKVKIHPGLVESEVTQTTPTKSPELFEMLKAFSDDLETEITIQSDELENFDIQSFINIFFNTYKHYKKFDQPERRSVLKEIVKAKLNDQ